MTAQSSFKRLVRARMAKTGESFTTARALLLAGVETGTAGPAAAADVAPLVCSEERIRERTGQGWEAWFDLLDSWGGPTMGHTELTRRVGTHLGIAALGWDAQAVVTSYERARAGRAVGQRVGGDGLVASVSKTIAASAEEVFDAFVDPSRRAGWLRGIELTERTASKPRSARFDVGDGRTRLLVTVDGKGAAKATVAVEQSRLADASERDAAKAFWRESLAALKADLEGGSVPGQSPGRLSGRPTQGRAG